MKIIFNQKDKRINELKESITFWSSVIGLFVLLIGGFIFIMHMLPYYT